MKKGLAFALIALLLLLAGCGSQSTDAYKLYLQATEKMADADALALDMDVDMNMKLGPLNVAATISLSTKQVLGGPNGPEMEMHMSAKAMGTTTEMAAYYTGGWYYSNSMGQRTKMPLDFEGAAGLSGLGGLGGAALYSAPLSRDAVKSLSVRSLVFGQEITLVLSGQALADVMALPLGKSVGVASGGMDISDITVQAFVDGRGNLRRIAMAFGFDAGMGGQAVAITAEVAVHNIRTEGVAVTFPDDLDDYTEPGGGTGIAA